MAPAAPQTSEDSEVLAGLIERVVFHSPETGFCVLKVEARGRREAVTIVGHVPLISAGEFVQASGSWANDRTHGLQIPGLLPEGHGADEPGSDREISRLANDPWYWAGVREKARRGLRRFGLRGHREQPGQAAARARHRRQARQADRGGLGGAAHDPRDHAVPA